MKYSNIRQTSKQKSKVPALKNSTMLEELKDTHTKMQTKASKFINIFIFNFLSASQKKTYNACLQR